MGPRLRCQQPGSRVADPISSPRYCLSEAFEIPLCSLCSLVMWTYTVQNVSVENGDAAGPPFFHPSPGLMLSSCLVFGCCVSSFTYRRQDQDPLQLLVYLVILGCAALIGYAAGAHPYLILLGYLPWATCTAMAISISSHGAYRYLKSKDSTGWGKDEEKVSLLA
ncbi:hypothetical protein VTH06DRAFT_540 [Thermothelomyces fergusii]